MISIQKTQLDLEHRNAGVGSKPTVNECLHSRGTRDMQLKFWHRRSSHLLLEVVVCDVDGRFARFLENQEVSPFETDKWEKTVGLNCFKTQPFPTYTQKREFGVPQGSGLGPTLLASRTWLTCTWRPARWSQPPPPTAAGAGKATDMNSVRLQEHTDAETGLWGLPGGPAAWPGTPQSRLQWTAEDKKHELSVTWSSDQGSSGLWRLHLKF